MKKFSEVQPINKKTLSKVPDDSEGVYRIIDKHGEILMIGKSSEGQLSTDIKNHQGRPRVGTHFQYITTSSEKETDELEYYEIANTLLSNVYDKKEE